MFRGQTNTYGGLESSVTRGFRQPEKNRDPNFCLLILLFLFNFQAALGKMDNEVVSWGLVTGV
jgi:hypothetical protein